MLAALGLPPQAQAQAQEAATDTDGSAPTLDATTVELEMESEAAAPRAAETVGGETAAPRSDTKEAAAPKEKEKKRRRKKRKATKTSPITPTADAPAAAPAAEAPAADAAAREPEDALDNLKDASRQLSTRLSSWIGPMAQPQQLPATAEAALAASLLAAIFAARPPGDAPSLATPTRSHAERLSSGARGLSLVALQALRAFFADLGLLGKVMGDVCNEPGSAVSVCALTRSTGLSLAETLVLTAKRHGVDAGALVGHATTYLSYSWTGMRLGDMLAAIERTLGELEAADGVQRYVWVDMFAASQTLLADEFRDDDTHPRGSAGYLARKEDTDHIFDDALEAIDELLLYLSPLTAAWEAPAHAYLLPDRGEPPANWTRHGPSATTRAWCMLEIVKALGKGAGLHVVLAPADADGFERLLVDRFDAIVGIIARIDARDAQISKVDDREYILGEVAKLEGGLGAVTAGVCAALRGWLAGQGRAALGRLRAAERGTSTLIDNLARMLHGMGEMDEAEALYREALEACRVTLGARHPITRTTIGNLGSLLKAKGDLASAEPLHREALEGSREVQGARYPETPRGFEASRLRGGGVNHQDASIIAATKAKTPRRFAIPAIPYEVLSWLLWSAFTIWWIMDRFMNCRPGLGCGVSPRQHFSIGGGGAGGDKTDFRDGPWTVKFYDVFARISARFLTPATNVMLVTKMHCLMHYLRESRCFTRFVDMSNCDNANTRMHNWWGVAVCACTLIHVWSIFGPAMFHGYSMSVTSGTFEWPASERTPSFHKDVDAVAKHVMLQVDDVWRVFEMTTLLGVLVPYSYRWLSSKYHLGIVVHNIISAMYVFDIIRRHSHPHNWFMNTPVFALWLLDRAVFGNWWRRTQPQLTCITLSNDYMLLAWNQACSSQTVGPRFFFRLRSASVLERSHVVTGFERRLPNFRLPDVPDGSIGAHFTSGAVVRVYHEKRCPVLSSMDPISHTHRIQEAAEQFPLHVWGPFPDDIGQQVYERLQGDRELCLVASGSAVCYLLDALQHKVLHSSEGAPVTFLYTCRDAKLFEYIVEVVQEILKDLPVQELRTIRVILSLTDNGGQLYAENSVSYERTRESLKENAEELSRPVAKSNQFALLRSKTTRRLARVVSAQVSAVSAARQSAIRKLWNRYKVARHFNGYSETIAVHYSRIDWQSSIPPGCVLFIQGSGGVMKMAAEVGKAKKCDVVTGPIYDSGTDPRKGPNTTSFLHKAATQAMGLLGCLQCPGAKVVPNV